MSFYENALSAGGLISGYRIERVLGAGSFGITYIAHDLSLSRNIALKEYFPVDYARRTQDGQIVPRHADAQRTFDWGLERFSEEARTLARFRHPNIVRVLQLLTDINNTGYIVMELLEGTNLEDMVKQQGVPSPEQFLSIFSQLLDGAESVHKIGILHRDIKPSNVMMQDDAPILIDFGSSRDLALQKGAGFSAVVTDGYSPLEQYSRSGTQGPYTDIYALAATAHFLLTGQIPPPSAARADGEALKAIDPVRAAAFRPQILRGIDKALSLRATDRPQSIDAWRTLLGPLTPPGREKKNDDEDDDHGRFNIDRRTLLIGAGGAAVALTAGVAAFINRSPESLNAARRELKIGWTQLIDNVYRDPFAMVAVTDNAGVVAAHSLGADDNYRMLGYRISDQQVNTGTWVSPAAGGRALAILPTSDGGAYVGGTIADTATVKRLDANWSHIWEYTYGSGTVSTMATTDTGIIVGIEGKDSSGAGLLRISPEGAGSGGSAIEIGRNDSVIRMIRMSNGGFAVLGWKKAGEGNPRSSLWIAMYDAQGQETVGRIQRAGNGAAVGWDITEIGGILYVTGATGTATPDTMMLMAFTLDGEEVWKRWDYGDSIGSGRSLAVSEGRLYVAGSGGNPRQMRFMQIGPGGDVIWEQYVPPQSGNGAAIGLALRPVGDGYAISVTQQPTGRPEVFQLSILRVTV